MPLGAFRLNSLARYVAPAGGRTASTITAFGNAQIDTAYSKFGGASALFDGTGDYLTTTGNIGDAIALSDYTCEAWYRPTTQETYDKLFDNRKAAFGNSGWSFYSYVGNVGYQYRGTVGSVSGNFAYTWTLNQWHHVAFVKYGTYLYFYIDGNQIGSRDISGTTYANSGEQLWFGCGHDQNDFINGHIDEIRVSNVARYTSTFVPPTQRFVNDENTLLLIHCDGTDGSTTFTDDTDSTELASWQDWTTSKMGSLFENDADTSYISPRGIEPLGFVSDDKFYALYANPATPFYYEGYHTYSRSGTTLTFDGRTEINNATWQLNFTTIQNITLESFNKNIVFSAGNSYVVIPYSNGNISPPSGGYTGTITGITLTSDTSYIIHPADDSKMIIHDIDGDMQLLSFNNSTNTFSVTTNTTTQGNKVANATNAYGFWTLTGSTYKFALLYWDTSATTWKVRHYAADLTSYTDTTLNNAPAFSNTARLFQNYRQPVNKALCVVRDTTNNVIPSFIVSWNGSSFTQHTTANISTSDSTYVNPDWMTGVYYLEDGVWVVNTLMNDEGGDAYVDHKSFILAADGSNNVGKLGEFKLNLSNTASNGHVLGGVSLGPSKDYAVVWGSDTTNGVTARLIWRT